MMEGRVIKYILELKKLVISLKEEVKEVKKIVENKKKVENKKIVEKKTEI